ncbi:glutamic acid-rich protein-like [Capsicum annuum]|uniref:glutamic acid-rich protein-like n=1 Tax=Capsicum annuum TaxID=4072 RepID=UPI001FB107E6|nr:glutamic acid-rich protein-like [Capsicum annuum]
MNKVLQNGKNFHFKVTKNKSITAAKLISLMIGNRLNNQQKLKCALVWFVRAMLLAKDPSKKTDLIKQKEAFVKRNNASYALFGFPWMFLVWIYEAFLHMERYAGKSLDSPLPISHLLQWHTSKCDNIMEGDPFKYKENNTKILHPYLIPTIYEMEQKYMKNFKSYTDQLKDMSIDALKAQLKGVTVLTSSVKVTDEDEDLGGNHYVPSPPCACDHAGSSELKSSPNASNEDDMRERISLLEKSLLNITSFVRDESALDSLPHSRHQLNLKELAVAVTNIAATDEKGEEEKKEEEMKEENAADEEDTKEEEEEKEKHEEMTAEAEEENEEKTKEDGKNKSEEEEDKNEKVVEEELVVE